MMNSSRQPKTAGSHRIKAIGLLSGGLDSTLAARLMMEHGVEVHAINFVSPFCTCTAKGAGCPAVVSAVRQLGAIPLTRVILQQEYLDMVRKPRFGYGRAMNPCIDCRIMKIRKAGETMREIGADFLFTGEVLGQRPMSQHRKALETIDRASGLEGLIVRPLSCGLLPPTIPERRGWIDRDRLCSIAGRSRKTQIGLAHDFAINDYPCPAGGCLLTEPGFAGKLKALMSVRPTFDARDVKLLKASRFEVVPPDNLLFIARNEQEGHVLKSAAMDNEHLLIPRFSGPTVLLRGHSIDAALAAIVRYTKPEKLSTPYVDSFHAGEPQTLRLDENRPSRNPEFARNPR